MINTRNYRGIEAKTHTGKTILFAVPAGQRSFVMNTMEHSGKYAYVCKTSLTEENIDDAIMLYNSYFD